MKNKVKKIVIIIGCFFVIGNTQDALAQIKFGTSETAGAIMSNIQKAEEWVQNQVNTASQKMQELITGPKIQAAIEKIRALKESITAAANEIKDAYDDVSGSIDAVSDNINETVAGINEQADQITGEVDNITSEVDNLKQTDVGTAANLTMQLADINQQIEDRKTAISEEVAAKAQAAQDNYATLQAMYDAAEDEADKAVISSELETLTGEMEEYNTLLEQFENNQGDDYLNSDSEYQALIAQRDDIEAQLGDISVAAADFAATTIKSLLSKNDAEKQEEYNKVITENFLKQDEANTAENVARIMKHRREVFKEDIAHVLYTAIKLKLQLDEDLERITTKQENMAAADYKMTAGNMLVEQRIEDIKILYNYTNLLIADLRLKTSQNMLNQDHRLKNYDKNPAALNLDNYIFTEDDIPSDEGEKSFLDSVTAD